MPEDLQFASSLHARLACIQYPPNRLDLEVPFCRGGTPLVSTIKPLQRPLALGDQVYQTLRAHLRDGTIATGQPLQEVQLAERLGVSRTPVREALTRLASEGLLASDGRSFVVPSLTLSDVDDIYEVRFLIEPAALRRVAELTTDPGVRAPIDEALAAANAAYKAGDADAFREAACAASANPFSGAAVDAPEAPVGYEMRIDASNYAAWVFAFGGDIFDYEAGVYTLNTPEAVEAITFVQGLIADGCARIQTDPRAFSGQRNFGLGTSLFTIASSSGFPFYQLAATDAEGVQRFNWSAGVVPHTTEEPVMNLYGASVSIPATSPEQELATWIFVKFLGSQEVMALWGDAANYYPTRGDAAELLDATFERMPAYAATFPLLQYAYSEPGVPGYDPVRNEMANTLVLVWDFAPGSTPEDVQSALDALDEIANDILAEFSE